MVEGRESGRDGWSRIGYLMDARTEEAVDQTKQGFFTKEEQMKEKREGLQGDGGRRRDAQRSDMMDGWRDKAMERRVDGSEEENLEMDAAF